MKSTKKQPSRKTTKPVGSKYSPRRLIAKYWRPRRKLFKAAAILVMAFVLFVAVNYAIAFWFIQKHKNEPLVYGTTFISGYAEYFGLDPEETMNALVYDMGFERLRLVSYWSEIEKTPGTYDFSDLDWQIKMAEEAGVDVNLSVGLRQPRWPECHMPDWAKQQSYEQWYPQLKEFITATVNRYKDSPAIISYQVENEFFMTVFGDCPDFTRDRLIEETELVRSLDPDKKIIITRSNNWGGIPLGQPQPDEFGVAVYKRVWDQTLTYRYFEYPYPPWFYSVLGGLGEIVTGKTLYIHEIQMEPWLPPNKGFSMTDVNSIEEQDKSMNAERLADRFDYAKGTGMRTIDTWGAEWWYWRKVKADDPSLWNTAKAKVQEAKTENQSRSLSD